jgi:hypothetical protein
MKNYKLVSQDYATHLSLGNSIVANQLLALSERVKKGINNGIYTEQEACSESIRSIKRYYNDATEQLDKDNLAQLLTKIALKLL